MDLAKRGQTGAEFAAVGVAERALAVAGVSGGGAEPFFPFPPGGGGAAGPDALPHGSRPRAFCLAWLGHRPRAVAFVASATEMDTE